MSREGSSQVGRVGFRQRALRGDWSLSGWRVAIFAGLALSLVAVVADDLRPVISIITGATAVITSLRFIRHNQGVTTRPLLIITLSGGLGIIAAAVAGAQETLLGRPPGAPGISEGLFALSYIGLAVGVESLRRARTKHPDAEGLIDGIIVSVAVYLLIWVTLLGPGMRRSTEPFLADATNVVFVLLAAAILAVLVRLAIGPGARAPSWYMLAVAVAAFIAADVAVTISPSIPAALSPVVYTFVTAAMRHPSMPRLVERDPHPATTVGTRRFLLLTAAMVVAPITLVVLAATSGRTSDLIVAAVGAVVISALVLARLSLMLRAGAEQARLEQTLRQASDRLLLAPDRGALEAAATDAVRLIVEPIGNVEVGIDADATANPDDHAAVVPFPQPERPDAGIRISSSAPLPVVTSLALQTFSKNLALAIETVAATEEVARARVERWFKALVENASDLIVVANADHEVTFVSPAASRLLGRPESDIVGTKITDLPVEADVARIEGLLERADDSTFSLGVEVRLRHANGSFRWFEVAARDLTHQSEIEGFVLNCREVSDRKDAELRLFRSEARFRALVQNVGDVVAVIDERGRFTYVSPAITPLLGYRPEQLLDTEATAIIASDRRNEATDVLIQALRDIADRSTGSSIELRALAQDGTSRILDVTVSDLRHDPAVEGIVLNARDVTERKHLESTLRHQANHDALTGLANRTLFAELVEACVAERLGGACVLFIDLDDFKTVNDSLGHAFGDELLVAVARRLTASLPTGSTAARLGGDEFAVLVRPSDDDLGPVGVALRLLHELRVAFDIDGWEIIVTASIGIAAIGDEPTSSEVVLRNADMAMYLAKERGKDRVELFKEAMHVTAFERLELKADLARAITSNQLALVYQPVVSLETGRITGAEALVRWDHPRRGRLGPDAFIAIAEETGLIVQLGQWVLEEACQQLRTWQLTLPADAALSMSVNLSVRQLEQPTIVDSVRSVLDQFALEPNTLTLEITETVVIDHMEDDRSRLASLKELGVNIALDDFGTGYSSLRYADDLPIDVIKVDRSFVAGITDNEPTPVLEAIVALGARLGVHTVAEGIERPGQIEALRAIGCDLGQGYWFSRPVDARTFAQILTTNIAEGGFDTTSPTERRSHRNGRNG